MSLFENFNLTELSFRKPPDNNSLTTFKELKELKNLKLDPSFVKNKDEVVENFQLITEKGNEMFPSEEITNLLNESAEVIISLKNHFNRPRPNQLAKVLGVDMEIVDLKSAKTPSYPSGHSAQAKLLANVLSDKYPKLRYEYQKEADDISDSRNIGGLHFKTDSDFGKELGERMYEHLKDNRYGL